MLRLMQAMVRVNLLIFYHDCINFYVGTMQKALNDIDSYFSQSELFKIHYEATNTGME